MTRPEVPAGDETVPASLLEQPEVESRLGELVVELNCQRVVAVGSHALRLSFPVPWDQSPPPVSGRLPFANQAVELLVVDEPRALSEPTELAGFLRECWRVAGSALVLVSAERAPLEDARFELGAREVISGPITVTRVPGGLILVARRHADSAGLKQALTTIEQQLAASQTLAARLRAQLNRAELERDDAQKRLGALSQSLPYLLSGNRVARRLVVQPVQKVTNRFADLKNQLRARGLRWPDSFTDDVKSPPPEVDLSFAGVATRARPPDPDDFLAQRPKTVSLCHPEWRGIRAATLDQVDHVIEVPGFPTRSHALRLAGFLRDAGVERVVMNGYPPGTELFAAALAEVAPTTRLFLVWHGTPAQSFDEDGVLQSMLELYQTRKLYKVGFVKHGLAEYFRYRGARAEWVMNRCLMPALPPAPSTDGRMRIGVFAPYVSHKNVETQLVAALLVPGAEVHTLEQVRASYLQAESHRIRAHGLRPRAEFLELLRTMHATTYVSLVECYPMTVLESIFCGVICVTSNTSVIFDDVPELREALVVPHHDSPAAIASKLSSALEQRDTLIPRAQAHLLELNARAEQRWKEFLEE